MSKNDRLLERLRSLDPADPETVDRLARDADALRDRILADPGDELAVRRAKRRRIATTIAAVIAAIGLIVPIVLLSPLAGNDTAPPTQPGASGTITTGPIPTPSRPPAIEVLTPARDDRITSPVTIRGTADVYEATVSFEIVDASNNVIADGFTTATCGTGCRGEYETQVEFSVATEQPGVIKVFEESAEDGSRINMVRIPVTLVPGP
jgi:hypothetical protein